MISMLYSMTSKAGLERTLDSWLTQKQAFIVQLVGWKEAKETNEKATYRHATPSLGEIPDDNQH